MHLNNKVIAQL